MGSGVFANLTGAQERCDKSQCSPGRASACGFERALTSYPRLLCFGFPCCWLYQWVATGSVVLVPGCGVQLHPWTVPCSLRDGDDLSVLLAFSCFTPDSQTHGQGQNVCIAGRY